MSKRSDLRKSPDAREKEVAAESSAESSARSLVESFGKSSEKSSGDTSRESLRTWLRLLACTNVIEGRVKGLLREKFDSTLPRFDLLASLYMIPSDTKRGMTMSELSKRMMVTNGNLTGLVDRLARERLISRTVDPKDRRTQLVKITEKGRVVFDEMTPDHSEWIGSMFAELDAEECKQLYKLVGKLKSSALSAEI